MKLSASLLVAPILLLMTACSSHYRGGHGHHHRGHVSIGVHGGHHSGPGVLGALIVGGVIGHLLTEDANQQTESTQSRSSTTKDEDNLVNGYPISKKPEAQKSSEQNRYYQLGKDGNCYLMEKAGETAEIISLVPKYSCG